MNFFGHAVVASWRSGSPGFALGAMLPDFATMVGARVPAVTHAELEGGVRLHHETDRVFHDAPLFRELQAEARRDLRARGLPRPSALAVAHIGVEMLLDLSLAEDPRASALYVAALEVGTEESLGRHVEWAAGDARDRFGALRALLATRGAPQPGVDATALSWRVARALAPRPRLRIDERGEEVVRAWALAAAPRVSAAAPALVQEIASGLAAGPLRLG